MKSVKNLLWGFLWQPADWFRWSVGITAAIVCGAIIYDEGLGSEVLGALLPLAVTVIAIALLDPKERPLSKSFCKAVGVGIGGVLAISTLLTGLKTDEVGLLLIFANLLSIAGMIFGIIVMVANFPPANRLLSK